MPSVPSASGAAEPGHPPPPGTGHRHEARRPDCPWCGAGILRLWPSRPQRGRGRAGGVGFDECPHCAHVFRNPRPTAEAFAAALRDRDEARASRSAARRHRTAARALLPFPEPESWLDVGTGSGHFPAAARELFPYTSFDGVDPGRRVVRAYAAGRVEEAHVGRLTDPHITTRLRARYDVVSLLHHLEVTPAPRAELHAALTVLRPGGHLLVEVADPHGSRWPSHARPHHLHLPPAANIEAELRAEGCTIVTATRCTRFSADRRAPVATEHRILARRD